MPDQGPIGLGELRRVENTDVKEHLESKEYLVGWVLLDGVPVPMAFTQKDLERPLERAKKNREDIKALEVRPPDWEDVNELKHKVETLEARNQALIERGLLQRILNTTPED